MPLIFHMLFTEVKSLHSKETWAVESDDEYGGTTQLVSFVCCFYLCIFVHNYQPVTRNMI